MLVMPSSNGCRTPAGPCCLHSGRASRQRTPWWSRAPSSDRWPKPVRSFHACPRIRRLRALGNVQRYTARMGLTVWAVMPPP
jgi:hypothetical protein